MKKSILIALGVLVFCAPAWAKRPKLKTLIKDFEAASPAERARLAPALGRAHDRKAVDALLLAFDVKRGEARENTAYVDALAASGDARAVDALSSAWDYLHSMTLQLGELPPLQAALRCKILAAFGRMGGERAVAVLSEAINDKDTRVVEEAVRGLGRLQVRPAVPVLQQLAAGSGSDVLRAVLEALGQIGDKRALSTLEQAYANPDPFIQIQAAYGLAKLGNKQMILRLNDFLKGDPGLEKASVSAAYYLVKLDADIGLAYLEKLMAKADNPNAPLAAIALGESENPRAVLVLVEAARFADPGTRLEVARALGRLGGPRAIATLRKMLADANAGVRAAATTALADLGEIE